MKSFGRRIKWNWLLFYGYETWANNVIVEIGIITREVVGLYFCIVGFFNSDKVWSLKKKKVSSWKLMHSFFIKMNKTVFDVVVESSKTYNERLQGW